MSKVTDFNIANASVASFSVDQNQIKDEVTGEIKTVEQVIMTLTDGTVLFAPLDAISRAMSVVVAKKDLRILRSAKITYATGSRTAGMPFNWRPSDDREFTATTNGVIQSVVAIEPIDRNWDYVDTLPIYQITRETEVLHNELELIPTKGAKAAK